MIILLAATCLTGAAIGAGACYVIMRDKVAMLEYWNFLERGYIDYLRPFAKIGLARKRAIERQNAKRKAERAGRVK